MVTTVIGSEVLKIEDLLFYKQVKNHSQDKIRFVHREDLVLILQTLISGNLNNPYFGTSMRLSSCILYQNLLGLL